MFDQLLSDTICFMLADVAAVAPNQTAGSAAQQQVSDASPWAVEDFVIGRIPEDPPPFELCH